MRQLLLLRHAKAETGPSDHARPLSARGRRSAAGVRTTLRDLGLLPDVVLVSSARRTLQTLEALGPWDETPIIEPMDGLYLASPQAILAILAGVSDTVRSLMLVGHNPGLHELAMTLAGGHATSSNGNMMRQLADGFPTGGLAEFTVPQAWRELGGGSGAAGGRLVRFVRPPGASE